MLLLQTQEEWVLDLTCGAGGLLAKVNVASLTNVVVGAIFLILLSLIGKMCMLLRTDFYVSPIRRVHIKLMSVSDHF
jgi:hypothetical protein